MSTTVCIQTAPLSPSSERMYTEWLMGFSLLSMLSMPTQSRELCGQRGAILLLLKWYHNILQRCEQMFFCVFNLVRMHGACALVLPLVGAVEWYQHCDLISYCNMLYLNDIRGFLKVVKNTALLQSLDPAGGHASVSVQKKAPLRGLKNILSLFYWAVFFLLYGKKKENHMRIWTCYLIHAVACIVHPQDSSGLIWETMRVLKGGGGSLRL